MSFINIEIKARCENTERIENILLQHQARFIGVDHQVDTYFQVPAGRLKLREGNIENSLIFYHRPDQEGPKMSSISMYKTTDGSSLKAVLQEVMQVKVVVDKKRRIYFVDNVKFHLDEVRELGSFVEIEAIDYENTLGEAYLRKQVDFYLKAFEIRPADLLAISYSDLLLDVHS